MKLDFFADNASDLLAQHKLSLSLTEAQNLQTTLERPLTLTEAIIFDTQLSEHCSYRSSRNWLKKLPTKGEHVLIGPGEDAGIIKVLEHDGEKYTIAVGHESHNSPSQIVPYEGAATGVGGIVRDILCMGARPCGVMDQLRLGDPDKTRQRNIIRGVIDGISGYGNPLGVPNIGGDSYLDEDFDEMCLVNVTAIGSLRYSEVIHSYVPKNADNWDLIIVGKATDNSGFGGASFSSQSFAESDDAASKAAAVQQPNPFLERHLVASFLDLFENLRKTGDFKKIAVKDLGAGGVLCATVEICEAGGFGAEVDIADLHIAKPDTWPPHVLACSETQERFCIACDPSISTQIIEHFETKWEMGSIAHNAGASIVGKVRAGGQYKVRMDDEILCDVPANLVTEGIIYDREFTINNPVTTNIQPKTEGNTITIA